MVELGLERIVRAWKGSDNTFRSRPPGAKTILVESRKDPAVQPTLDAIADECAKLGYRVVRWRGPISGRVAHSRRVVPCDLAILFNGAHPRYTATLRKLRRMRARTLFVELGWYPQMSTFHIDPDGINAAASWVNRPLAAIGKNELPVPDQSDLLVILQHDDDTQITQLSPWFSNMYDFVDHMGRFSRLPVRVRAHPRHAPHRDVVSLVRRLNLRWDHAPELEKSLKTCKAVATINSSSAIEALVQRIPVLCHGHAIYRHRGAVYCLDSNGELTQAATEELINGRTTLKMETVAELVARVRAQQWTIADIPRRLPHVLDEVLEIDSRDTDDRGLSAAA